ncbi:MAG: hypothetical protein WBF54_16905 [Terriglobales bacterium]
MELLDRYLQAVEFWLPKRQRQDIIAELSEDLRSQVEEKESELGRKLKDDEVETILKRCGSPVTVASRYQPQRYLIGPTLFPVYRFVLGVLVLGAVVPRSLIWLGFVIADSSYRGYLHMENLWTTVLSFTVFTTLAFAILEQSGVKLGNVDCWSPGKLPPLRHPNRIPRSGSLIEIAVTAVCYLWFVSLFWPRPVIDFYGAQITVAPIWRNIFSIFVLSAAINLAIASVNLFRPYWTRVRASLRLLGDGLGAGALCWLLKAQVLIEISAPSLSATQAIELTKLINLCMIKALPWAIVSAVVILGFDVYRIVHLRSFRLRGGSMTPTVTKLSNSMVSGG